MARGRPATPLGTWGTIETKPTPNGTWRARTRLRLWNGKTVEVTRTKASKTAAIRALKEACTERLNINDTPTLTSDSKIQLLLETWLDTKDSIRPQSRERYQTAINKHINPAIGNIRIREITPMILHNHLHSVSVGTAGNVNSVLKGSFKFATRLGLMQSNPMDSVEPVKQPDKEAQALSLEEIPKFRARIAASKKQRLIDIIDVCMATGLRAGEVLAARWQDIDWSHNPPVLHVTGTVVVVKGKNFRQNEPKTKQSKRPIQLIRRCVEILERRYGEYGEHLEMVFPSDAGTYMSESNLGRWIREARGEEFKWVTVHTLRSTVATIVHAKLGAERSKDLMGHATSALTERVYVQRDKRGVQLGTTIDDVFSDVKTTQKIPE